MVGREGRGGQRWGDRTGGSTAGEGGGDANETFEGPTGQVAADAQTRTV